MDSKVLIAAFAVWLLTGSIAMDVTAQREHSPRGALVRSLAVPGWGQLYNRQYYKVPIVYAGLGLLTYVVLDTNSEYLLYRRAFLFKAWDEEVANGQADVNPFLNFESHYVRLLTREGLTQISSGSLEPIRDNLRRNRDLAILGMSIVYALSTLDAYVSAHLLEFDIGDDLSLRVVPKAKGASLMLEIGG
ncbi:MAG: hypothetical protein HKN43_09820 [Rhodothermales bacterium]|nr:hypothetical protein [Rhodothermales bacterium]